MTGLGVFMMANFAATESAWRVMLESVGLRVVRVWTYEIGTESLIECELA
jgi:hypothetical protein